MTEKRTEEYAEKWDSDHRGIYRMLEQGERIVRSSGGKEIHLYNGDLTEEDLEAITLYDAMQWKEIPNVRAYGSYLMDFRKALRERMSEEELNSLWPVFINLGQTTKMNFFGIGFWDKKYVGTRTGQNAATSSDYSEPIYRDDFHFYSFRRHDFFPDNYKETRDALHKFVRTFGGRYEGIFEPSKIKLDSEDLRHYPEKKVGDEVKIFIYSDPQNRLEFFKDEIEERKGRLAEIADKRSDIVGGI